MSDRSEQDFPPQGQQQPGTIDEMAPDPDHGEDSYVGSGRLAGKRALITGGDSGIGRAVAIAFAREGADVVITAMPEEEEDASGTVSLIEDAGRTGAALVGDLRDEAFATSIVDDAAERMGGLDIVVLNAAYQADRDSLATIPTEEFDRVFRTNLYGLMFTARAALPRLTAGASIIVTSSVQAFQPSPGLIDYAMTKAAQVAFVKALAQEVGERGIRVNAVAPGPIWTPLIPATGFDEDKLTSFGSDTPLGRAGQPAELAGAYVYLASDDASYTSGAILAVTGGKPL
ncbi:SDR family oxidoreductase [Microbacterium sp. ET2]|uniref:SDR family oxidoreductase n=1 Tax=Microbacterium albipurpureum TaxID=3050384 RepID=UPI00259D0799|nr:SDR family oxidoreductase [Microbacterium sp. ET2 (Ac-2212)]WJL96862.1 SDR family oxidoreductase [Microbacterium sp. ET2 (Ac-2212)]